MKPKTEDRTTINGQFSAALAHFWKGDYAEATAAFEKIRTSDSLEPVVADRVRTMLAVCSERLSTDGVPVSAEEFYVSGIMLLNKGRHTESIEHLKTACGKAAGNDAYRFSLACAYATAGRRADAIATLTEAIRINPENRIFARNSREFIKLMREDGDLTGLLFGA